MLSRSRRTGPTPTESIAMSSASRTMSTLRLPWRISVDSRHGCGATRAVVRFVEWLRARNDSHSHHQTKVRFYGLDLYSLRASMEAVVAYLDGVDPEAAAAARERYSCFDHVRGEGPEYGHAVALDVAVPCENEVVAELIDLREHAANLLSRDGWLAEDEFFFAEQNARLVRNAERYYRADVPRSRSHRGTCGTGTWARRSSRWRATSIVSSDSSKIVVWEHNSHVGDARATELGASGELTVGQLVRSARPGDCVLVGFTTHHGDVTAASDWGGPAERKHVRPALPGSLRGCVPPSRAPTSSCSACKGDAAGMLQKPLLERAIGVVYRPETERASHWFHARLHRSSTR